MAIVSHFLSLVMTTDVGRSVRLLPTRHESGAMNMALDAVAAETVSQGGPASVRVYGWEPSTLSLGYAQDPETIDWAFCETEGIEVTRRPTGGGAIYHDALGDVSYSIVLPRDAQPDDLLESYHHLCDPLLSVFDTIGVTVDFATDALPAIHEPACYLRELHPAHDLVVETADGTRKISGNAQHRQRDAIVQHGSITVHATPQRHLACFSNPPASPTTFTDRVTGLSDLLPIDRETVIDTLEAELTSTFDATPEDWQPEERTRAHDLVEQRFGADSWVVDRTPTEH